MRGVERQHDLIDRVTVVRARGKAILVPLINVLRHFKIDFGIVHDSDTPFRKDGAANGMWTENNKIREAIQRARVDGVRVRHRINVPDFERYLGSDEVTKDKPLNTYLMVVDDADLGAKVQTLLQELLESEQFEPLSGSVFTPGEDYGAALKSVVLNWARENGFQDDPRYRGKP